MGASVAGEMPHGRTSAQRGTGRGTPAMRPNFRHALAAEQPLILFGAYDALSARLIARAGCPACFISGFSVVGSRFGVPEVGLRAFGDISGAVRDILQAVDLPVLVDADDGYGDVKNVRPPIPEGP